MNHSAGPGGSGQFAVDSAGTLSAADAEAADSVVISGRLLETSLSAAEVLERLAKRSRNGRLAGFRRLEGDAEGAGRFGVTAFGGVYDFELIGSIAAHHGGSRIEFEMRLMRKTPIIAAALIVFTVFPGLPLTHSMLSIYFSWYRIETWWWYLPLVVLTLPLMWKQFTASRAEACRDAVETIEKIERVLKG
jgi:hypothetical protein